MNTQTVSHMGGRSLPAVKQELWEALRTNAAAVAKLERLTGADHWTCSCGSELGAADPDRTGRVCLTLRALQAAGVWLLTTDLGKDLRYRKE